jgi:hypothetical protein
MPYLLRMKRLFLSLLLSSLSFAHDLVPADEAIQRAEPYSFALNPEALPSLRALQAKGHDERRDLVQKIQSDLILLAAFRRYPELDVEARKAVLVEIFSLQTIGTNAPRLIYGKPPRGAGAYYVFDLKKGGPGTVYIDLEALAEESNVYAEVVLLIHETRHASQFVRRDEFHLTPAFTTQKRIFTTGQKLSSTDFTLLIHEYEAFQFANFVVNRLTDGQVNIEDMGTPASQFNGEGSALLDLAEFVELHRAGPVPAFNAFLDQRSARPSY